jgi:hypothetical protein
LARQGYARYSGLDMQHLHIPASRATSARCDINSFEMIFIAVPGRARQNARLFTSVHSAIAASCRSFILISVYHAVIVTITRTEIGEYAASSNSTRAN